MAQEVRVEVAAEVLVDLEAVEVAARVVLGVEALVEVDWFLQSP